MKSKVIQDLKITRKTTGYTRGKNGYEQILHASLDILIEHGYKALTFRKIATACNMNVGNVQYYFKSKEILIRELLDAIFGAYHDEFDRILETTRRGPKRKLAKYITVIIDDLASRKTTRVFPELWALANHEPLVEERLQAMYRSARERLHLIIEDLNPTLSKTERETLALFIVASMEGLTIFAGHEKPWENQLNDIKRIAIFSFTTLINNITTTDIKTSVLDT